MRNIIRFILASFVMLLMAFLSLQIENFIGTIFLLFGLVVVLREYVRITIDIASEKGVEK